MEDRLQHQPAAHEPQRAHTNRVRSTPQGGAKLEQILLMSEGKSGSRSPSLLFITGEKMITRAAEDQKKMRAISTATTEPHSTSCHQLSLAWVLSIPWPFCRPPSRLNRKS